MVIEQIRIKTKPIETIFFIETYRVLNTIALGGVETGNIKAQEAAMVAGSIRIRGEIFV